VRKVESHLALVSPEFRVVASRNRAPFPPYHQRRLKCRGERGAVGDLVLQGRRFREHRVVPPEDKAARGPMQHAGDPDGGLLMIRPVS